MGKFSRDKGARVERRIVNLLKEAGIPARRVPLSGATEYAKGDVEFTRRDGEFGEIPAFIAEVKARKEFPGWLLNYLGGNDALFLVENRREPLVVLPLSTFTTLL